MAVRGGRKRLSGATAGAWCKGLDAIKVRRLCGRLGQYFAGRRAHMWFAAICARWRGLHGVRRWPVRQTVFKRQPLAGRSHHGAPFLSDSPPLAVDIIRRQIAVSLLRRGNAFALTCVRRSSAEM